MKTKRKIKKMLSIALLFSLVLGITAGIAPVKAFADGTVDITVSVTWNDNENTCGMRPDSITVELYDCIGEERRERIGDEAAVTTDDPAVFSNVAALQSGHTFQVVVTSEVDGYTSGVTQSGDTFTVTMTHTRDFSEWRVVDEGHHKRICTCGADQVHEAVWGDNWWHDSTGHWRVCTQCDLRTEKAAHTYENGVCSVCGAPEPVPAEPEPEPPVDFGAAMAVQNPVPALISDREDSQGNGGQSEGEQDDSPAKKADETLTLALNIVRSSPKTNIKNKGITLDTKNWVSFNSETYRKIDELVAMGVPVTFKYVDNGYDCTFTIPANFASKLESYCDKTTGCIGFEALAFKLVSADYDISYKKEKIDKGNNAKSIAETRAATATFLNSGADLMASQGFEQAANAVAVDSASKAQSGGAPQVGSFTPFAAFGGSQMRAESG